MVAREVATERSQVRVPAAPLHVTTLGELLLLLLLLKMKRLE